jgi:hypothetical protein
MGRKAASQARQQHDLAIGELPPSNLPARQVLVCGAGGNDESTDRLFKATLDHVPDTTGRDGAIDFAAKVEASRFLPIQK